MPITKAKPFLKWVGGKRSIVLELEKRLPKSYLNYYEPFLGGGALFFHLQPQNAYLSDINFNLIITYFVVQNNITELTTELKKHKKNHSKEYYKSSRQQFYKETNPIKLASLFIYLNKTCFNGLYRVNKAGVFNVPMGAYKNPKIIDEENLLAASKVLQGIKIEQNSFEYIEPIKNCFYYFDPPYYNTYSQYDENGFGEQEHKKLFYLCNEINKIGSYFMISNSSSDFIKRIYKGYNIEEFDVLHSVSCKKDGRKKKSELIIRNY